MYGGVVPDSGFLSVYLCCEVRLGFVLGLSG